MRLLQGSGQPNRVGDVASGDEALLRPGLPAEVLLSAERANHGDAEGPWEHHARYQHLAQRNNCVGCEIYRCCCSQNAVWILEIACLVATCYINCCKQIWLSLLNVTYRCNYFKSPFSNFFLLEINVAFQREKYDGGLIKSTRIFKNCFWFPQAMTHMEPNLG